MTESNVLDSYVCPEMPFLQTLADELLSTLRVIAYTDHYKNKRFIRERQRYFKKRYERFLDKVVSDEGQDHVIPAYDTLQTLLENTDPEEIQRTAEECIYQHLDLEDVSEDYSEWAGRFSEFFESNE